jgi:hypothetical protein
MDPHAGGFGARAELARDIVLCEIVDDAEPDRLELPRGKLVERLVEPSSQLPSGSVTASTGRPSRSQAVRSSRPRRTDETRTFRAIANSHGPAVPSSRSRKRVRATHACANVSAVRSWAASRSRVRRRW